MATVTELEQQLAAQKNLLIRYSGIRNGYAGLEALKGAILNSPDASSEYQQNRIKQIDIDVARLKQQAAETQSTITSLETQLTQARSDQAQTDSAAGQTAEQKITNDTATSNPGTGTVDKTQDPQTLTAEEKAKLAQSQTGASSATSTASRSESSYNESSLVNQTNSVAGKDVTGKKSDYQATPDSSLVVPTNKLHDYTSYTYRITLFFLTARDYNNLAAQPGTFEPTFSLISSSGSYATPSTRKLVEDGYGGSYIDSPGRHPDFQTDFFIDNLQLTTQVGLNAKTKASNAIDISFNITEPYGLSLLDRLLSACETSEDRNPNYMSQPYLLQIDLLSSPTDEKLLQLNQSNNVIDRKRIAIKFLEMKIKPTGSGTTYAIRAIPFNHTAFNMTVAAVPIPFTIEASTVGEFFGGQEDIAKVFADFKIDENRLESELKKYIDDPVWAVEGTTPTPEQIENKRRALKNALVFKSKSFTAAYNVYMKSISDAQKLSSKPPTKIAFNIPSVELASSPIVDELAQNLDSSMFDQTNGFGQADDRIRKIQNFSIHKGTSIIEVIDQVLGKSDYIKNQINTLGKQENTDKEKSQYSDSNERTNDKPKPKNIKWYKIIPTVALENFDFLRNNYSKTILYSILPYNVINAYHPNFPKGSAQSVADQVVRKYDYLYTGKNQDIIRLDIDFDTTYYTQLTTYRNQVARQGQNAYNNPDKNGGFPDSEFATSVTDAESRETISNPAVPIEMVGSNADSNSMNTSTNPKEKIVADLKKSIYTTQRGDALNIKVQILGDPAFIKQDDIYYNPGGNIDEYAKFIDERLSNCPNAPINKSGQILFDAQQVYVQVNFKNAVDINDNIGIVNKQDILSNGRRTDGTFSGVYKILSVQSEFNKGQFTQTLDLIRVPDSLPKAAKKVDQVAKAQAASNTDSSEFVGTPKPTLSNSVAQAQAASNTNTAGPINTPPAALVTAADQTAVNSQGAPENANNAQSVSPQNTAGWTYSDAFAQARKDFGNKPGGVFEYKGKLYQTNYQNEPYVVKPTPVYPGAN